MIINDFLYEEIFQYLPLGLFVLDSKCNVIFWNEWMVEKTKIKKEHAIGKTIGNLFPSMKHERFNNAVEQIQTVASPQVLSQTLNHYIIPIPSNIYEKIDYMQQHVEVFPLKSKLGWLALVVIQDVTDNVHQKNTMMQMASKLEEESYHDALTAIYNRRFLWEYLEQQIAQAKRGNYSICCCMFDLDYFKKANDDFGHSAGDQILTSFVNLINGTVRSSDVFVRYGGEEFLLIMPHTDITDGSKLANKIRVLWEEKIHANFIGYKSTCSAGLSLWKPKNPVSSQELVDLADKALYKAKEKGRNCVVF